LAFLDRNFFLFGLTQLGENGVVWAGEACPNNLNSLLNCVTPTSSRRAGVSFYIILPDMSWFQTETLSRRCFNNCYNLPVYVVNDSQAVAIAEHTYGQGHASGSNFIMISALGDHVVVLGASALLANEANPRICTNFYSG
jgi:hypothetical protein